jgi:hypothetical protein
MHRTRQEIYCRNCGYKYTTDFGVNYPDGKLACSRACYEEIQRKEIAVMFPPPLEHWCGLQGFGRTGDDECPACRARVK